MNYNLNKNRNNVSKKNLFKNIQIKKYITRIVLVIVLLVVLYLLWKLMNYIRTDCYQKHSFLEFLRNGQVCKMKDEPKKNNLNVLNMDGKEVFHISNQDYTYNEAKCKCASYNSRLAKYDEIVDAYNKGANWCTYGWSYGQNAYYPVQKCNKEKDKYCGYKDGINGGFFPNPKLKFGVNCYGIKPAGRVVKPKVEVCEEQNVCSSITQKLDTDVIAPFNLDNWNE